MLLPLLLLIPALLAMGLVAYGMRPDWAAVPHGVQLILLTRRLEWVLVILSILLCLALIALVVSGRRRAWWLVGLLPIILLFLQQFGPAQRTWAIHDDAAFLPAEQAPWLHADDWVVGLEANGIYYAYPYSLLYAAPVVFQTQQARRILLLWSPFANRATACWIDRQIKPRELDVVSMPANALLLYNSRYGQFINGFTGRTMSGERPIGFHDPLPTVKTTWGRWRARHPATLVLRPMPGQSPGPSAPLKPYYKLPDLPGHVPPDMPVALIDADVPIAVTADALRQLPSNFRAGPAALLLVRDEVTGSLRAFNRAVGQDLYPEFHANPRRSKHRKGVWIDTDTGSAWDRDGTAVSGPMAGEKVHLREYPVEMDLYWGVLKFWYPHLAMRK